MYLVKLLPHNFNDMLSSAIDDTIREALGQSVLNDLYANLRSKYDIGREELPYRTETIYEILENMVEVVGAKSIGPMIAERFYRKLGLPFYSHEGYTLPDYIQTAKTKLASP